MIMSTVVISSSPRDFQSIDSGQDCFHLLSQSLPCTTDAESKSPSGLRTNNWKGWVCWHFQQPLNRVGIRYHSVKWLGMKANGKRLMAAGILNTVAWPTNHTCMGDFWCCSFSIITCRQAPQGEMGVLTYPFLLWAVITRCFTATPGYCALA